MRRNYLLLPALVLLILLPASCASGVDLRALTGEEDWRAQLRGLGHLLSGYLRPYPASEPLQPVRHAGLYPFAINTFLQIETEPDKVERSLDMIAGGGFRWIRQEFTWEDLEIHHDDWFVDLRNGEIRNAWEKYDRIVSLAEERDIQIIARLSNPPTWSRATGDAPGSKAPPDYLEDYADYVSAVVSRYRGRIHYFQIWNEPNCCEEWGQRRVSPEQYTDLLKVAYTSAKAANPGAVIITAPLAQTIELSYEPAFNDFLFLQRMYDAGAGPYFDILAINDYGLWSGPTDHRMRPRVINYSRPEYLRDIMLRNGDGQKPIWISEMGWNSTPVEVDPMQPFGFTPEALRGHYLAEAFERQQREWPWAGVSAVWFFKQANRDEENQAQYYFRLVSPEFEPLPAWDDLTAYIRSIEPVLFRGYHQEEHWVLRAGVERDGEWALAPREEALFEQVAVGEAGERLRFTIEGASAALVLQPGSQATLDVTVGGDARRLRVEGARVLDESGANLATRALDAGKQVLHVALGEVRDGRAEVELLVVEGQLLLDGVIVR